MRAICRCVCLFLLRTAASAVLLISITGTLLALRPSSGIPQNPPQRVARAKRACPAGSIRGARASLAAGIRFPRAVALWKELDANWHMEFAIILLFLLFLWAEFLRRRVRSQKTLLQEWARREVGLKERYAELFENANDVVFTTDLSGKLTSINRAAEKLTGYSREESFGADITDYIAEEYREQVFQAFNRMMQDRNPATIYLEIVTKNGGRLALEASNRLVFEDGRPIGLQGIARDITERKIMEKKLLLREKRLASFFSSAPAGLAILDDRLRLMQINETLAQLVGLSPQETIGRSLREVVPKLAPVIEPAMRKVLEDRKALVNFSHEGETPSKPGVIRHLISSYFPLPALEGEGTDIAVITVEVTDRKRAEDALRESEERLNSILSSLRDVVWSVEPASRRLLYLNPATETVYGRRVSEFYEDPRLWLKAAHPDDRARVDQAFKQVIETGSMDLEYRIVRSDGEVRWLHDRSRLIRNPEGAAVRLDGISTDITDRKHTEEGLKLYREVFARSNEAVAILDPHYHFIEQNEAYRNLLGYSDSELRQMTPAEIMGESSFSASCSMVLQNSSHRGEAVFTTHSGNSLDVELSAFSILSDTGEVLCFVCLVRDITAQKRTELERQKAREAAEAANRAKSEFLANMSHEIRTPLNGILGMTELTLNTDLTEEQREYLDMVRGSGETLLTVINDILDFSKIEAGRLDINPIDFELRDSLGDTLKTLALRAHQ